MWCGFFIIHTYFFRVLKRIISQLQRNFHSDNHQEVIMTSESNYSNLNDMINLHIPET